MYDNAINMCEKIPTNRPEDHVHANNVLCLMSHLVAEEPSQLQNGYLGILTPGAYSKFEKRLS